jgi:hypothetical protein
MPLIVFAKSHKEHISQLAAVDAECEWIVCGLWSSCHASDDVLVYVRLGHVDQILTTKKGTPATCPCCTNKLSFSCVCN